MTYRIEWEPRGAYVECHDRVDLADLHEANGSLHGHPDFDEHRYQIWNLLAADLSPITESEMVQPATLDRVAERSSPNKKVALVVQDAHATRLCDAYIKSIRALNSSWECCRFEDVASARAWIQG